MNLFNTKKEDIIINVDKEEIERLKTEYEINVWEILEKQLEYSERSDDKFRIIDKKSAKRLFAKKLFSIRKLNIVPIIHIDENGHPHFAFGGMLWKDRVYYCMNDKNYWCYARKYETFFYPDFHSEIGYVCVEGLTETYTFKELMELMKEKNVKVLLQNANITMSIMNDEKMTFEMTGFFKSGQNILVILIIGIIIGFTIGGLLGFIISKVV